jgi:Secreted/periplasmic Zn-dependent peptidases, insulinase-like
MTTQNNNSTLIKSINDYREYKYITLDNGIKVVVISDPKIEVSHAVMRVNVGSMHDPKHIEGLTHFLEHMLFMGSDKYPDENHYSQVLSSHNGESNAYTSIDNTVYYFSVECNAFGEMLDIFSRFFIDPLFKEDSIEREINAIDSEFFVTYNDDHMKFWQVVYDVIDKDYPINKFACGNKKSLGSDIKNLRKEMLNHYYEYYSPDKMSLVIVSKHDINYLTNLVKIFEQVKSNSDLSHYDELVKNKKRKLMSDRSKNKNKKIKTDNLKPPFTNLLKSYEKIPLIKICPNRSEDTLDFFWQTPCMDGTRSSLDQIITGFISHIIGYEGEGSLFLYLKKMNLIESLSTCSHDNSLYSLFNIEVTLTDKGNEDTNLEKIIEIIIFYINFYLKEIFKNKENIQTIYNEEKQISKLNFDYQSINSSVNYLINIAENTNIYDDNHILSGSKLKPDFSDFMYESIYKYCEILSDEKPFIIHSSSSKYKTNKSLNIVEKWYGTNYGISNLDLSFDDIPDMKNIFHLPNPNIYIPSNLSLNPDKKTVVQITNEDFTNLEFWICHDTSFNEPKTIIVMDLVTKCSYNIEDQQLLNIYLELFNDHLNEKLYAIHMVGHHCNIVKSCKGMTININGYSDKVADILKLIIDEFRDFIPIESRAQIIISSLIKDCYNERTINTCKQAFNNFCSQRYKTYFNYIDKIKVLESIKFDDVLKFKKYLLDPEYLYIALFMQGNFSTDDAEKIYEICSFVGCDEPKIKCLKDLESPLICDQKYNITEKFEPINPKEKNLTSASLINYDILNGINSDIDNNHIENLKIYVLNNILVSMISEDFFIELRTKQQLGYIVDCSDLRYEGYDKYIIGIKFVIQSPNTKCDVLNNKIHEFVSNIPKYLNEEKFKNIIESKINVLSQKFKTLSENAYYNYNQIKNCEYIFNEDKKKMLIDIYKEIKYNDIIDFYKNIISSNKVITINVE